MLQHDTNGNLEKTDQKSPEFSLAIFVHPEVLSENVENSSPLSKLSHELEISKQHIVWSVEIPALRIFCK